ncbi:MAG: Rdx family protein [Candidatus Nanohaloarchaeota archaeon QJJ-5]|nr:Rdx family protein [Candidatus Nanohaloarchaeota archaeon QJJ-5]
MTRVEIEYCVPCRKLERAIECSEALLARFSDNVDEVALVTGAEGIFQVRVDGDVVFDTDDSKYSPEAVTEAVGDALH